MRNRRFVKKFKPLSGFDPRAWNKGAPVTYGQSDQFKDVESSPANDPLPVVDDPGVPSEEDGQLSTADDPDVLDREDDQRQAADDQEPMIAVDCQSRSTPSTVQQSGRPPKRGARTYDKVM